MTLNHIGHNSEFRQIEACLLWNTAILQARKSTINAVDSVNVHVGGAMSEYSSGVSSR